MANLVWEKKLSVGNVIIDAEHRNLISMVNDANRAIETRDSLTLLHELERLENWLHTHFANEEKIAQAVDFPFARLKPAQQYSLNALRYLRDELEAKYGMWSESIAAHFSRSLKHWIIEHITKVDMPMKTMLQAHDYNFWPGYTVATGHITASATSGAGICGCGCGCGCDSYSLTAG
jgi:hemerythrin